MSEQINSVSMAKVLGAGIVSLLVIKLFLAARLDLYSDEVFYFLESTLPALAYSDLPFMTSLMVGLGSAIDSGNPLATRFLFILMGSSIPLVLYWVALPITNKRHALESAILALCIPLGGFLGLLAVPDVPLLFFGMLAIGFFERALRTNKTAYWLGTGVIVALGFCTHYRFFLYPTAALLYLMLFERDRKPWQNPRLWISVGIAAVGLLPVLWFNLDNQLASVNFYFVDRHPWTFQASGLLHVFKQAGVVTPPLYLLLGFTLWKLIHQAMAGDRNAAFFACFASVNILVYLVLAPWSDSSSTTLHWPLSGYFPLLVFAPFTLRTVHSWTMQRWGKRASRNIAFGIPGLGFVGSVVALLVVGSQAFQLPLQSILGTDVLSNKMAGWVEFSEHTRKLIDENFVEEIPILVTDNYYTAAQIEFAGLSNETFTLDNDKAVRDGRVTQFRLWQKDASGLLQNVGRPVLFINEDSTLTVPDKQILVGEMCGYVKQMNFLSDLSIFNGEKQFSFYLADQIVAAPDLDENSTSPCPYPARAWIDPPVAGDVLSGTSHIEGWAYNEDIGIDAIYLLMDGQRVAQLNYGATRVDVVEVMGVASDPNAPDLGFSYELDTTVFENGEHTLAIRLIDSRGVITNYGERIIEVAN